MEEKELFNELDNNSKQIKDIKKFFDLANDNVKSATEIFNKCVDMRKKVEGEKRELEKLRKEHEDKSNKEIEKIKTLKETMFNKLKEKKSEIDDEVATFKSEKAAFEKAKQEFETEKNKEYEALKEAKEKQDEEAVAENKRLLAERKAIEKEREQLEEDKVKEQQKAEELAVNLNRFNELVKEFTSGMQE